MLMQHIHKNRILDYILKSPSNGLFFLIYSLYYSFNELKGLPTQITTVQS